MNTKLTLSLDKNVIEDAKRYADDSKTSLSDIVENYFKAIVSKSKQQPKDQIKKSSLHTLRGSIKKPLASEWKKDVTLYLKKKHEL